MNYIRLAMFTLSPIVVIIIANVFWFIRGICKNMDSIERRDKTVSTVSILWFLFYPSIVSNLASSINCKQIEDTNRLYNDLEEECYRGSHFIIMLTLSMSMIRCWR